METFEKKSLVLFLVLKCKLHGFSPNKRSDVDLINFCLNCLFKVQFSAKSKAMEIRSCNLYFHLLFSVCVGLYTTGARKKSTWMEKDAQQTVSIFTKVCDLWEKSLRLKFIPQLSYFKGRDVSHSDQQVMKVVRF